MAETPDEDVSMFEVLSDRYEWVNVRAGPAMNAAKLGQKRRGATVAVDLRGGSDDNWVRTVETFGAELRPGFVAGSVVGTVFLCGLIGTGRAVLKSDFKEVVDSFVPLS